MSKNQVYFDESALEVVKDVYDIGGGTVVVDELPEVGEEHTIYELQEKKVIKPVVPMVNEQMIDDEVFYGAESTLVFTTTEEMNNTFNSVIFELEFSNIYLNYITDEDKLIGAVYENNTWHFTEATKVSSCKFEVSNVLELENPKYIVILKEYLGEVQGEIGYHAVLFNEESYVFEPNTTGIVLGIPTIGGMSLCICEEELPEIPPQFPSEYVFEDIPYEKIINGQLPDGQWIFTPEGSGEVTVISYWIYSNGEWVNMDDIPATNLVKIGITCTNGTWSVATLPLNSITVTYDDVDYRVTQYAETEVPTEQGETVTYYGYIEVPMPTQDNLTHTIKVSTSELVIDWFYAIISGVDALLNNDYPIEIQGIPAINIYYSGYIG